MKFLKKIIDKQLKKIDKKEKKILNKKNSKVYEEKVSPIINKVEESIPDRIKLTLDNAFYQGFNTVLSKGTKYIEKLYDKEKLQIEHDIKNYAIEKSATKKKIKELDSISKKSNFVNATISTVEGGGLGLLGIGIHDIPLFITMILKTVYEIALSYGFNYEDELEQVYILNLICGALTSGDELRKYNSILEQLSDDIFNNKPNNYILDEEIRNTSKVLSQAMLTTKFIQGVPIIGVIGGIINFKVINKVSTYSKLKYKKRYLQKY